MSTATANRTLQDALNSGNPAEQATAIQRLKLGDMMEQIDETITLSVVAASIDLSLRSASLQTALLVQSVRVTDVTGGTGATGVRTITDAGGTPSATVATLSADGKTLTFEGTVKAIRIVWIPKTLDPDTKYATT